LARILKSVGTTPTPDFMETLYLPFAQTTRAFPWEVFHGLHRMGAFASQEECFRHALRLADSIGRNQQRLVRLRIEDEQGTWTSVDGYVPSPLAATPARRRLAGAH
jgi:hypothetical protein